MFFLTLCIALYRISCLIHIPFVVFPLLRYVRHSLTLHVMLCRMLRPLLSTLYPTLLMYYSIYCAISYVMSCLFYLLAKCHRLYLILLSYIIFVLVYYVLVCIIYLIIQHIVAYVMRCFHALR